LHAGANDQAKARERSYEADCGNVKVQRFLGYNQVRVHPSEKAVRNMFDLTTFECRVDDALMRLECIRQELVSLKAELGNGDELDEPGDGEEPGDDDEAPTLAAALAGDVPPCFGYLYDAKAKTECGICVAASLCRKTAARLTRTPIVGEDAAGTLAKPAGKTAKPAQQAAGRAGRQPCALGQAYFEAIKTTLGSTYEDAVEVKRTANYIRVSVGGISVAHVYSFASEKSVSVKLYGLEKASEIKATKLANSFTTRNDGLHWIGGVGKNFDIVIMRVAALNLSKRGWRGFGNHGSPEERH